MAVHCSANDLPADCCGYGANYWAKVPFCGETGDPFCGELHANSFCLVG